MERLRKLLMNSGIYDPDDLTPDTQGGRFGPIEGVKVGDKWDTRKACCDAGVHRATTAGIVGSYDRGGAYSIVLSGGYEDDIDEGDEFFYTGAGGRGPDGSHGGSSRQIKDQSIEHPDNRALKKSVQSQRPVRVIRGANADSEFAPLTGYRYDGLYMVESAKMDKGKSGFQVCRFKFRRLPDQDPLPVRRPTS